MNSKVLLIDPPLHKNLFWDPVRYSQPLGLWSLASHLESMGHEVEVFCMPGEGWDNQQIITQDKISDQDYQSYLYWKSQNIQSNKKIGTTTLRQFKDKHADSYLYVGSPVEQLISKIKQYQPDLIGISVIASCSHLSAIDMAQAIRQTGCTTPIVVGGQHPTAMAEQILRDSAGAIDWVIRGEGEQVLSAIADAPDNPRSIEQMPGICYLDDNGQFRKNKRPHFFDLDEIALPKADVLKRMKVPAYPSHTFNTEGRQYTDIMFSVGCHNNCAYCFSPQMRGRLRQHSEAVIRKQLEDLWEHGYRELILQDDDLLHDRQGFYQLLNLFKEYGFYWQDNGGIELELLDDQLIDAIADSNCTGLYVPINPRKLADRLPNPAALIKTHLLHRLKDHGIYTFTSGIYGVPNLYNADKVLDEVRELRDFHLNLLAQNYVDASLIFPLSALPGTKWYHEMKRHPEYEFDGANWLSYSIFVPQIWPKSVGKAKFEAELVEVHRQINHYQTSYPWFSPFPNHWKKNQQGVVNG